MVITSLQGNVSSLILSISNDFRLLVLFVSAIDRTLDSVPTLPWKTPLYLASSLTSLVGQALLSFLEQSKPFLVGVQPNRKRWCVYLGTSTVPES